MRNIFMRRRVESGIHNMTCKIARNIIAFVVIISPTLNNAFAQTAATDTLATVNSTKITRGQLTEWTNNFVSDGGAATLEVRQAILNDLIIREAINQDLKKTSLLKLRLNEFKIQVAQQNAMMEIWFSEYLKKHPITESDLAAQYEKEIAYSKDPKNSKEYLVSQIAVENEAEGNQIIAALRRGASFEGLAKEKSVDKNSAEQGGQLGWLLPTKLKSPINDLVSTLVVGQVSSKPIKVENLWFIIRVRDVRPFVLPSFEQAKPLIAQALVQEKRQQATVELLKTVKIVTAP